jgi:menaquinone-dependent protoporphyrinogen oxidase
MHLQPDAATNVTVPNSRANSRGPHLRAAEHEKESIMSKILVAYGTTEGQTAKIAEFIAEVVRGQGHAADAVNVKQSEPGLDGYDAVIVGGSIHMGKHEDDVGNFVRRNRNALERKPSALFSVSLAAHGDTANAEAYVARFEQETGWRPAQVGLFAGALLYSQYGFFKRQLMKKIVRDKPGDLSTDTSRDYVYTEWDDVRAFTERFLDRLISSQASEPQQENA